MLESCVFHYIIFFPCNYVMLLYHLAGSTCFQSWGSNISNKLSSMQFHAYKTHPKHLKQWSMTRSCKFITPLQFGFIKNCSTLQQMPIFIDYITDSSSQTDLVYFDISSLLKLLTLYPMSFCFTNWDLRIYWNNWHTLGLADHLQCVWINNCYSDFSFFQECP